MARVKQLTSPSSGSQDKVYGTDWNAMRLDYISMSGTVLAQTIARLDHATFKSISTPAAAEGRLYFNGTYLQLRSGGTWKTIPGGSGTAGLCDSNPQDIGGTALPGSSSEASRCDHVHRGVTAIKKTGEANLYGTVTFTQGASIGITQAGQDLQIDYTGGAGSGEPHQAEDYLVFVQGGTWKARDGDDGVIDYSNVNPRIVVNQALAAVGGGAYQRKVVIRGNV